MRCPSTAPTSSSSPAAAPSVRRGCAACSTAPPPPPGIDFRECEYFVGTSAGSIVAAFLAAGRAPDSGAEARAARDWAAAADGNGTRRGASRVLGARSAAAAATPLAPLALATATPGGAVARAAALRAAPRTTRSMPGLGRLIDARGRALRRAPADRRGRPPQRPPRRVRRARTRRRATVGEAVLASCSVPWIFAPVRDRRARVRRRRRLEPDEPRRDPGRRGTEVLCLNPTASLPARAPPSARCARSRARPRRGDARAAGARRDGAHDRARRPRRRGDGREPDGPRPRRRGARRRLRPGQGAGGMSHQDVNRALGTGWPTSGSSPPSATGRARTRTGACGGVPEAEVGALPDVDGLDTIELGCGTAYFSAWLARRGARPVGVDQSKGQLATARAMQAEHGIEFPLIEADAEAVPLPDASFDFALSEYGASLWCEPERWIAEAARLLRPGGRLVFLTSTPLLVALLRARGRVRDRAPRAPAVRAPPGRVARRRRPLGRVPPPPRRDDPRCSARPASRSRRCTSCSPPADADDALPARVARVGAAWPSEEIWVARKR